MTAGARSRSCIARATTTGRCRRASSSPGRSWEHAALREVEEETGLRGELVRELDPVAYLDRKGRHKLVRWWLMRPLGGEFEPNDEVDELRWEPLDAAVALLDYPHDHELVRSVIDDFAAGVE